MARRAGPRIAFAAAVLAGLVGVRALEGCIYNAMPYWWQILVRIGIAIILAVSLNLINGITGQFSLGHMGFAAVGGYTAAAVTVLAAPGLSALLHIPAGKGDTLFFFVGMLAGGLLAALAGLLVGLPTLRLRGDYLAIATLGFGEIVRVVILNVPALGGPAGFKGIPMDTTLTWAFGWAAVTVLVVRNIRYSRHGRSLLAIREDEVAAEAMGVDTVRYKVLAFSIGAFFAGVAGALLGHYLTILDPASFGFLASIEIVVMVVVGGMGSIGGAVFAAAFLTWLPEGLRSLSDQYNFADYRMILYSLALIVLMLTRPQGLFGHSEAGGGRRKRRRRPAAAEGEARK